MNDALLDGHSTGKANTFYYWEGDKLVPVLSYSMLPTSALHNHRTFKRPPSEHVTTRQGTAAIRAESVQHCTARGHVLARN